MVRISGRGMGLPSLTGRLRRIRPDGCDVRAITLVGDYAQTHRFLASLGFLSALEDM